MDEVFSPNGIKQNGGCITCIFFNRNDRNEHIVYGQCDHPDNKESCFDPFVGIRQARLKFGMCEKWNENGFCGRFKLKEETK